VRFAPNDPSKRRLTKPDARGARHQHSDFCSYDPNWKPNRRLSRLAGRQFTLLTCAEHLDELRATLRKPAVAERITPYKAGGLVNELKELAEIIGSLPRVERSPDPTDDFLLALSEAGKADYLVTGDKGGLLALEVHKTTRIISVRKFAERIKQAYRRAPHRRNR
jgi:predicted nucleic acid-binding protein